MGIRIHKVLGYGITNLKARDPRFPFVQNRNTEPLTFESLVAWTMDNRPRLAELVEQETGFPDNFSHLRAGGIAEKKSPPWFRPYYQANAYGHSKTLVLVHPAYVREWFRHDDAIDYYEAGRNMKNRTMVLRGSSGPYPFEGVVRQVRPHPDPAVQAHLETVLRPGRPATVVNVPGWGMPLFIQRELKVASTGPLRMDGASYRTLTGYGDKGLQKFVPPNALRDHFRKDWRPELPTDVLALIEWSGLFPDPFSPGGIAEDLRPMIHTWWD